MLSASGAAPSLVGGTSSAADTLDYLAGPAAFGAGLPVMLAGAVAMPAKILARAWGPRSCFVAGVPRLRPVRHWGHFLTISRCCETIGTAAAATDFSAGVSPRSA